MYIYFDESLETVGSFVLKHAFWSLNLLVIKIPPHRNPSVITAVCTTHCKTLEHYYHGTISRERGTIAAESPYGRMTCFKAIHFNSKQGFKSPLPDLKLVIKSKGLFTPSVSVKNGVSAAMHSGSTLF